MCSLSDCELSHMGKTIIILSETRFLLQKLNEKNVETFFFFSEGIIKLLQLCCLGSKGSPGFRIRSSVYALLILKLEKLNKRVYVLAYTVQQIPLNFGRLEITTLWQEGGRSPKEIFFSYSPI